MDSAELDIENRLALQRYLAANFSPAEEFEILDHRVLAGGVSSRTVRVELSGGQIWVLKQALAKLRVAADWFSDPVRVHREALGMRVLGELAPAGGIPRLIFDDERHHVLGMEAVAEPHENWKSMLLAGRVDPGHVRDFGRLAATIHRLSFERRRDFEIPFGDRSFFESLRIEPYYEFSARQELRSAGFYARLIADTRSNLLSLVHGDYSPKNVLVQRGRLVLLDHEVIHWGDPTFDVGFAMTHFLSKLRHVAAARALFTSAALGFWSAYWGEFGKNPAVRSALDVDQVEQRCVRQTLGCLLARVVGRSPLEYLSPDEKGGQRDAVLEWMTDPPREMPEMIMRFCEDVDS